MIRKYEELCINAFPALKTLVYNGWIIRLADGYSKRANSVSPIYEGTNIDIEEKIKFCEDLFKKKNQKTVFKLTSDVHPGNTDLILANKGYQTIDETIVMIMQLENFKVKEMQQNNFDITIKEKVNEEWLENYKNLNNISEKNINTFEKMLNLIVPKTFYLSIYEGNNCIGNGQAVIQGDYAGIFDIVVKETERCRGIGRLIVEKLLSEAVKCGAKSTYLQVVADNIPANKLYKKIGYKEIYRYWYRVK